MFNSINVEKITDGKLKFFIGDRIVYYTSPIVPFVKDKLKDSSNNLIGKVRYKKSFKRLIFNHLFQLNIDNNKYLIKSDKASLLRLEKSFKLDDYCFKRGLGKEHPYLIFHGVKQIGYVRFNYKVFKKSSASVYLKNELDEQSLEKIFSILLSTLIYNRLRSYDSDPFIIV